ncbi:MAG: DUF6889 family protein [Janthinobacterium lividum]
MPDGEDYLMRPVDAGYYRLHQLDDQSLTLDLVALANDYLDAKNENENRAREAMKDGR